VAKKHKHPEHVNHERWLVSYADFITLLFAFFVVMFAVSQVDSKKLGRFTESVNVAFQTRGLFAPNSGSPLERGGSAGSALVPSIVSDRPSLFRYTASSPRAQAVRESLEEQVDQAGLGSLIGLRYDERGVVVSLPESLYFRSGSANLKSESLETLSKVAEALADQRGQILVEGHTDDLPVNSTLFTSNWELSAARAARVVRYLVEEAGFDGARLAAIGLADTKPLTDNVDEASREVNRRVQIVVVTETNTEE
jgi:chemotaxis protein MotB